MDREKVIICLTNIEQIMIATQDICPPEELQYWIKLQKCVAGAIALLKEKEPNDKMFHALEEDWKRLKALREEKELLKEQEAVEPKKTAYQRVDHIIAYRYRCGTCDMNIFPSYKYCPFCGQAVKWE